MHELSLLVLTRNSEDMVLDGLEKIRSYLAGCDAVGEFEVIVCDYSQDSTPELVRRAAAEAPQIRYCGAGRAGIGAGIRAGLAAARLEYAMTYPIDMAWDLEVIGDSVRALGSADVVFGSRYAAGSQVSRPLLRRLFSLGYRLLVQAVFGLGVRDLNGTVAVRMEAARAIRGGLSSDTAFLPTEMAIEASSRGMRIAEIPCRVVDMRNNSVATVSGHTRDMLRDMIRKKRAAGRRGREGAAPSVTGAGPRA